MAEPKQKAGQGDDYQLLIGVEYLVKMIEAFETHVAGAIWMRMEDRYAKGWDDIAIGYSDTSTTYVQVKRYAEPLDELDLLDAPPDAKAKTALRDLLAAGRGATVASATLRLAVFGDVQVKFTRVDGSKREMSLKTLGDLCNDCRAHDSGGINPTGGKEPWWRGIRAGLGVDAGQAHDLLRRLHVDSYGAEDSLRDKLVGQIGNWYARPESVLDRLTAFAKRENRPTGRLTYGRIYGAVLHDEERAQLCQHRLVVAAHPSGTGLRFAGTTRWQDSPRRGWEEATRLDVIDPPASFGPPSLTLLRAILHWRQQGPLVLREPGAWWTCFTEWCGNDGISYDSRSCAWDPSSTAELQPSAVDEAQEDDVMTNWTVAMDDHVWRVVERSVRDSLPPIGKHRPIWLRWHQVLIGLTPKERTGFLVALLTVVSERDDPEFRGVLRVGARSAPALIATLRRALDFATLIESEDRHIDLDPQAGGFTFSGVLVRAVGLRRCSRGRSPRVSTSILDATQDAAGTASVLLLPIVDVPESVRDPWIKAQEAPAGFEDSGRPILILTECDQLDRDSLRQRIERRRTINEIAARLEEALRP